MWHKAVHTLLVIALASVGNFFGWSTANAVTSDFNDSPLTGRLSTLHMGVTGNDANNSYVGDGGLLLPGSFTGSVTRKKSVAQCWQCIWKYTIYCDSSSAAGTACAHAASTCTVGQLRYRVWFGSTSTSLSVIGSVCWGGGEPATRRRMQVAIRDHVIRYVPDLVVESAPRTHTLTSVPLIVWTNQPDHYDSTSFRLSGHTVTISAVPMWRWSWGDGNAQWVNIPGRAYPANDITHRFREPGRYLVGASTEWAAEYTVAGIGTFAVTGDTIHQQDAQVIAVHSSHTRLLMHR